jgi:hypothetical protein
MSKYSPVIYAIEDVNFSNLQLEETKPTEYSKYQDMAFANMKQPDGTLTTLYFKTPLTDYTLGGLPPAKDKEGNELFKEEYERAKWRYYMDSTDAGKKMLAKMTELQDKLIKEKSTIVGKKDEKKFELENIIGEGQNKDGESIFYVRFNFHTQGPAREIATKFFVRRDGIDEEIVIKTVSDFESQFRRGEFRYRMIVSLNKIYKQKKSTGKYGASFKVHQMLIEMRDDVASVNTKNMFAVSQFNDNKQEKVDLSKHIEDEDNDDNEDDEESNIKTKKVEEDEDDDEDEEEIKTTKVTVTKSTTKAARGSAKK